MCSASVLLLFSLYRVLRSLPVLTHFSPTRRSADLLPIGQALGAVDEAVRCIRYHAGCLDLPRGEVVNADPNHVLAMSWYEPRGVVGVIDRKSTRLNSSH